MACDTHILYGPGASEAAAGAVPARKLSACLVHASFTLNTTTTPTESLT